MKTQDEVTQSKVAISIADVKGNDEIHGQDIADLREVAQEKPKEEVEEIFTVAEQMPQFPAVRPRCRNFWRRICAILPSPPRTAFRVRLSSVSPCGRTDRSATSKCSVPLTAPSTRKPYG